MTERLEAHPCSNSLGLELELINGWTLDSQKLAQT